MAEAQETSGDAPSGDSATTKLVESPSADDAAGPKPVEQPPADGGQAPKPEGPAPEAKEQPPADGGQAPKPEGKPADNTELHGSYTGALLLCVFASTIGGSFQFGYGIGCMNTPASVMIDWFVESHEYMTNKTISRDDITNAQWSIAVSIFAVGGMVGGLLSGWAADTVGRKGAMLFNNGLAVIAAVLLTCAKFTMIYYLIIIGRVIVGINCGVSSGLVPMYLTEISPINLRGALGSASQLMITASIVVAQIVGLPFIFGTATLWPMVFGFMVVPIVVQLATLPFCVESPKYSLVVKNNAELAEKDLKKLRAKEDVGAEMKVIQEEAAAAAAMEKVNMLALFKGDYQWPMFISAMMMVAQQLSGINVAMYYSTPIFVDAGLGDNAVYATVGMGFVNVGMTVVSLYLVDHPKCGRRMLLLVGLSGMLVSSILLVVSITLVLFRGFSCRNCLSRTRAAVRARLRQW